MVWGLRCGAFAFTRDAFEAVEWVERLNRDGFMASHLRVELSRAPHKSPDFVLVEAQRLLDKASRERGGLLQGDIWLYVFRGESRGFVWLADAIRDLTVEELVARKGRPVLP
jgi:hypothetical protein